MKSWGVRPDLLRSTWKRPNNPRSLFTDWASYGWEFTRIWGKFFERKDIVIPIRCCIRRAGWLNALVWRLPYLTLLVPKHMRFYLLYCSTCMGRDDYIWYSCDIKTALQTVRKRYGRMKWKFATGFPSRRIKEESETSFTNTVIENETSGRLNGQSGQRMLLQAKFVVQE